MKILNVADINPSAVVGGLNLMVSNIANELCNFEDISVGLLYFSGQKGKTNKFCQIKFRGLIHFIRNIIEYDLFIFHSIYNVKYIFMMLLIFLFRKRIYIHSHGSLSKHAINKSLPKKIFYGPIVWLMLKISNGIIFSNESERKNSICVGDERVFFIPNLIDGNTAKSYSKRERKRLVYIGKIDYYYKGIFNMVESFLLFSKKHPGYYLDIYGYGENKDTFLDANGAVSRKEYDIRRLLEQLHDSSSIFFHGPIYPDKKAHVLNSCGMFVLTSRSEAMPLSISEALSHGTPVLITDATNMGDYVSKYNSGFVVGNDVSEIYEALVKYDSMSHDEYSLMGDSARVCFCDLLSSTRLKDCLREFLICLKQ